MKNLTILLFFLCISISCISVNAQTTEISIKPVYSGDDGVLEKVIRPKCLVCHSSERTGGARNGAPEGLNFDTFEGAKQVGNDIVKFAVDRMSMPPNSANALNEIEKQAVANWRLLGFPEIIMPPHYFLANNMLELPELFILDNNGDVALKGIVEMKLVEPITEPFRFEIQQLEVVEIESINN